MSRCLKCSFCEEDIEIGDMFYCIDDDFFCSRCTTVDVLDESFFEEDDSHAILEERLLEGYE